ncbi:flap endonuclease 1-B-like [Phragmites australis]|uniref:flap endonuclease 1-B-like n=1 Tax=Phragmites australis TaxID=29695 RepID=UPI002D7716A0|nr:flap endonuclease 1-B-like [Phragmites australis]
MRLLTVADTAELYARFVFDGEPPEMKKKELAKRSLKRAAAAKYLNRAIEVGDEDSAVEKIKAVRDRFSPERLKLLTPVASLPGSVTEKEPKCILSSPGQSLKVRSALQVCKSASSGFRYGSSKPFMVGRQSGFRGIPHAFSFI